MKIFTFQRLLFTLILSSIGFMAVGCDRSASSNQYKTEPRTEQVQQGYGRAPHPNSTNLPTPRTGQQVQQGYGRAPQLDSTNLPTPGTGQQQGYGRAPQPSMNPK